MPFSNSAITVPMRGTFRASQYSNSKARREAIMRERDPMPDDRRERYGARQRSDESYWSEHGYGYGPGYDLELMKPLIRGNGRDREKGSHFAQRTRDVMTHYVITIHPWE